MTVQELREKRDANAKKILSLRDAFREQGNQWKDDEQRAEWKKAAAEQDAIDQEWRDAEEMDNFENRSIHHGEVIPGMEDRDSCRGSGSVFPPRRQGDERAVDSKSPIVTREQSVETWMRSRGALDNRDDGLTLGNYMRAMVGVGKDPIARRSLSEGTDSAGGYTVPIKLQARLIDALRKKATVFQAGAVTVPLTTEHTHVAQLASDPQAAWRLELGAVAESDPTFERIAFQARSLAVLVKVSRELLEDSVNVEAALMNALAKSLALEVDRVALLGSGAAPEPKGIANTTDVQQVVMGTDGAALTDYDSFLDAIQLLELANAGPPTAAIMSPRTSGDVARLKDTTNQPLRRPAAIERLPFLATTQIPVDDTQGTSTDASRVIVGDFRELFMGMRTDLRIEVLRERYADTLEYGFLAHLRFDVALAHAKSFCQITGITSAV